MNSPKIYALYQNTHHMVMYGFVENNPDLLLVYIDQRKNVFSEKEIKDLYIEEMKFSSRKELDEFLIRNRDLFYIESFHGTELLLAGYERYSAEEMVSKWYELYKDVVVAGQILPVVLNMPEIMNDLITLSDKMYQEVNNFEKFTQMLSTNYIMRALIKHPITACMDYERELELKTLFEYQLFKDEESEVKE